MHKKQTKKECIYRHVIKGAIIILVVLSDAWYNARMEKLAQERGMKEAVKE